MHTESDEDSTVKSVKEETHSFSDTNSRKQSRDEFSEDSSARQQSKDDYTEDFTSEVSMSQSVRRISRSSSHDDSVTDAYTSDFESVSSRSRHVLCCFLIYCVKLSVLKFCLIQFIRLSKF